jgi:subtilisin family serine protease
LSVVLGGLVLSAGLVVGAQSAVSSDEGDLATAASFSHVNLKNLGKNGLFKPASLANKGTARIIVRFSGKSVGDQAADALKSGKTLSKAERAAIRAQVKSQQGPALDKIKGLGGKVTEEYQDAYNGAAVQIPLSALPALANVPGVESIHPDRIVKIDNTAGVQYIGGDQAWQNSGKTGNGVKVAVIDTGIDYFHANFGGSGNPNDFKNDNHTIIEPGSFPTPKVAGGYDFVGDAYDANSSDAAINTPKPDPDPADCNGHGSHTAGTAAGDGVLDNGSTYTGPYDNTTYSHTFRIGPGVAPKATIYAYRVFGCAGSASDSVIVAALNRAQADLVDVVNMSLGSPFGRNDAPDSVASNTLAENGIVVVASAGNSGAGGYITGSPAVGSRVLSVAAIDASSPTFPGATITLGSGPILAQLSNGPFQNDPGASLPSGPLDVKVIRDADGSVSLGCNQADYAGAAGKLAVVVRGVCARVHKAIVGQKAGAAAVAMVDTSTNFPPFEGDVTVDPDTGEQIHLTIPFFGVRGLLGSTPPSDGDKLVAADGTSASFAPTAVPNTAYQRVAGFSSGGPRNVDSAMKPEISAPGVSVKSTAMGTGNQGTRMSGTSMASPMTAGAAAVVTEAHPSWDTEAIKAALINTADGSTSKILAYNTRTAGSGVLQVQRAVDTVSYVTTSAGRDTIDFGYRPISTGSYSLAMPFTIHNTSGSAITYNLSVSAFGIAPVAVSPASLIVPAGGTANGTATASVPSTAGLPGAEASIFGTIQSARGVVIATPASSGSGIYTLRVPYMFVPRGLSNVVAGPKSAYSKLTSGDLSATIPVSNSGVHAGTADVYAWGITDANDTVGAEDSFDIRDVGVQLQSREFLCGTDPAGVCGTADDKSLIFAINNWGTASNPSVNEFDIAIDKQNDGRPDAFVVGVDLGAVLTGTSNGQFASFIFDKDGNLVDAWVADAPMNGSTLELPALASELGLNPSSTGSEKFNYWVNAFNLVPGALIDTTGKGTFRADKSPVSTGQQAALAPGQSGTLTVTVDKGKFAGSPQLGWLVATLDDANGAAQADEVPVGSMP